MVETEQLLRDLTDAQREAVQYVDGPLLIVAAAGSGKTRVITRRVAYLMAQGIPASSILAITFTNKAAGEMKQRVGQLLGRELRDFGRLDQRWPTICTFHSLCLRILRHYAEAAGLPPNFSIYDSGDQTKLIKDALKMLDISSTNFAPGAVHAAISNAKNQLLSPQDYAQVATDFYGRTVSRVYTKYQQLLTQNNALDFDDLLLRTAIAFREHPQVLRELQERFQYILIDEYQDTNHAQYIIAHALAQRHRNMCVVGDPDQCLLPGTLVTTPDGPRPIESLNEGDAVISATGWGKTGAMRVDKVMHRAFKGRVIHIETERGDVLRATPNHIMFAKLRADASLHYTYLMHRRGVGYRIGVTRGVRSSKDRALLSGLQVRTNQEVADAVWILHAGTSAAEARFYEHYYSVRYGIPSMVFFVRGRRMEITQEWIDRLYREIDTDSAAERLMADLQLDPRYPHHRPGAVTRRGAGVNGSTAVARKHVLFTVFGDPRPHTVRPWHEHRVQLVTSDAGLRASATQSRLPARDGVRGTWRIETSRKDYDAGMDLARQIAGLDEAMEVVPRARLTSHKAFAFMPASHIHAGMVVPVHDGDGQVVECTVASVTAEDYDGPVYDLSVPDARNYIAGGIVVHNSIYAWRGADIRNILEFEKDYPDAKVVKLEQNYRSTKTILAIADKLITHNTQRRDKRLYTDNAQGERARLILCQDEHDEARVVVDQLRELNEKQGVAWNDMAIFYRMNSLSRVMEDGLRRAGIPYVMARGVEFYNRKVIKDVLAYLRAIANPNDEVSLTRIVNTPPRGIGDASVKQMQAFAVSQGISLYEAMTRAGQIAGVSTRAVGATAKFVELMESWRRMATSAASSHDIFDNAKGPVQTLMEDVVRRSGLEDALRKEEKLKRADAEEGDSALANVDELISSASEYEHENPEGSLQDYLATVSLVSDADHMKGNGGAVTLMTLHAAKGLEFPVVAIIGLEEGILPHGRARGNLNELEEERRLAFVGITRAEQQLILTKAAYRTIRGLRERTVTSPFLGELPQEMLDVTDRTGISWGASRDDEFRQRLGDENDRLGGQFRKGQTVRHPTFGLGRITDLSDMGQHTRVVVQFNTVGKKTLILQYARLEPA